MISTHLRIRPQFKLCHPDMSGASEEAEEGALAGQGRSTEGGVCGCLRGGGLCGYLIGQFMAEVVLPRNSQ